MCKHMCMYVCIRLCTCVCVCTTYVCVMYVYVYVCMYVYMCVCIYMYICMYTYIYGYVMCMYKCVCVCMCLYSRGQMNSNLSIQILLSFQVNSLIHDTLPWKHTDPWYVALKTLPYAPLPSSSPGSNSTVAVLVKMFPMITVYYLRGGALKNSCAYH